MVLTQILLDLSIALGLDHQAVDERWTIALNVTLEIQQPLSSVELDDCGLLLGSFLAKLWGYFAVIGSGGYAVANWVEWIKF